VGVDATQSTDRPRLVRRNLASAPASAFDGFTIIQLVISTSPYFSAVPIAARLVLMNGSADLVVLTGDFVSSAIV
jgi:hypothetical protein